MSTVPMKCITLLSTDKEGKKVKSKVVRTTKVFAEKLVSEKKASFASKQAWKSDGRLFMDKDGQISSKS